ncbi:MAG: AraC family transcriptional regulator [Oscillospiraceae bacterium]
MDYTILRPKHVIEVDGLISVHYFEYSSNYTFDGESHDFWEFLYVDKGELDVTAGDKTQHLKKGQIIFHKPGEFHNLRANGTIAPNLVVASFVCNSPSMSYFEEKVFSISDVERALMAQIIDEAEASFTTSLSDPDTKELVRKDEQPFGCEQMIVLAIEHLLIEFVRRQGEGTPRTTSLIREKSQSEFVTRVHKYLEDNISKRLSLSDICRDNLVGRSYLQKIFREKTGGGAMEYFGELKIAHAKEMIRESSHNFTEISVLLGYNSIHYFSRHFKKVTGMTPSEYASSVKVLAKRGFDKD